MGKLWVVAGAVLVLIGLMGLTSRDWSFGKTEYERKWTFETGELRNLNVRSDYRLNVAFAESANGTSSVFLRGRGSNGLIEAVRNTDLSEGTLNLDLREPRRNWNIFRFLDFGFFRAEEELLVTLPENTELDQLGLEADSGSVTVSGARAGSADISADSGSISLQDLTAGKLNVKADSGSIKGNGIRAEMNVEADSGSIHLEGVSGPARIHAYSGSVKLYRDDTADTDISADSGSVYVCLPASFAGYLDLKADSGSIKAPESKRETKDLVKVRTDSGSIRVEQKR